jgi:hypothetical protein
VLVSERTISLSSNNTILNGITAKPETGNTYIVNWDGTEYTCVATSATITTYGNIIALGDLAIAGYSGGSGEPFVLAYSPSYNTWVAFTKTTGNHTFSISEIVTVIHKLDSKYIDIPAKYVTVEEMNAAIAAAIEAALANLQ